MVLNLVGAIAGHLAHLVHLTIHAHAIHAHAIVHHAHAVVHPHAIHPHAVHALAHVVRLPLREPRENVLPVRGPLQLRRLGANGVQHALSLLRRSGLSDDELDRVWHAADANGDGILQMDEFVQALVLAESRRNVLAESRRAARPRRRQRW